MFGTGTEPLRLVVAVALDEGRILAQKDADQIVALELVADVAQRLERHLELGLGVDLRFGIAAVVAVAAVLLGILLAEVVQQCLAAAHRTLGIGDRFEQQQLADFLLGDGLALHELLELLDILVAVEGQTVALAAVAARTARLLIVAFERLGNVIVNHIAHVGLVDTHAEGNGRHNHVDALHEEVVLVGRTRRGIHAGMVGARLDAVGQQQLGELLDLLAAQAVDDAALALVLLDEADDVAVDVVLGPYFIIEVGAVERRLEDRGVRHAEILLDVHLHLGGGGSRQGDERSRTYFVDDGADTSVLGTEVMSPLRDAVRLVDGIERNLDFAQEGDVVLLGQRLGREVEQLGLALEHVGADLLDGRLVERRIEEVCNTRLGREGAHGVHLVLHQGDERRDDDGDALHQKRRKLVAQRLAAARGHQYEGISARKHVADDSLLVPLERIEAEILLQLLVQQRRLFLLLFHVVCTVSKITKFIQR